ncbi:bactericidal permeability-increasing protein-like isoform X1 [Branchiostoma lanceolatum]|uniref:bactericidal permeability-increasing protein-like isoform X1 n=1 Tax=Branchiostoma lanceolatum TaxID=7740 RepID=UPI003455DE07
MKLLCALTLLLAVVAAVFHGVHGQNPGLKAKVTEFGLTYGMKVFLSLLKDRAQEIKIPNQSGRADVVIGKVDYQFTNIKMTAFNIGGTSLPVVPREGLRLRANGVSASLNGDWHYSAKVAFIPIRDGGTLGLSISDVSLDVVMRLGKDAQDRPTISVGSCSAHIGDVSVKFHGGASWLYNLFKGAIENTIKNQLNSELCKSVSKAINEDVEKSFAQIRVLEPVGKFADLDLGLLEAPSFQTNFMELPLKGAVVPRDSSITVPVSPGPIPEVPETSRMIYLYGSEYVGNAIANIYHKAGQLRHVLKPKDIPKDLPFKLNTTYLAGLVPKVGELYPDMGIELVLNTSLPPHLSIRPGHATLTGYGNVHVYATPQNKPAIYLFSINVTMDLGAEVKLIGELLYGNVSMDPNKIKITTFGSTVGPVPTFGLDFAIRALCQATVPWINTFALDSRFEGMLTVWTSRDFCRQGAVPAIHYLAQGIPFHLKDVLFENAQVVMHQGFISIGTDLKYTGQF